MFLTKGVCFFVFALEMKHVNCEANVGKIGIRFDVLSKRTIVVEEDMVRLKGLDTKRPFEKFLEARIYVNYRLT